jgi:hypothetical protein
LLAPDADLNCILLPIVGADCSIIVLTDDERYSNKNKNENKFIQYL